MTRRIAKRPGHERRQREQRVLVNHRKSDEDYAERMSGGVRVGIRERDTADDRPTPITRRGRKQ
jgi:hypothetical protein